jgi:hypothetical protein
MSSLLTAHQACTPIAKIQQPYYLYSLRKHSPTWLLVMFIQTTQPYKVSYVNMFIEISCFLVEHLSQEVGCSFGALPNLWIEDSHNHTERNRRRYYAGNILQLRANYCYSPCTGLGNGLNVSLQTTNLISLRSCRRQPFLLIMPSAPQLPIVEA